MHKESCLFCRLRAWFTRFVTCVKPFVCTFALSGSVTAWLCKPSCEHGFSARLAKRVSKVGRNVSCPEAVENSSFKHPILVFCGFVRAAVITTLCRKKTGGERFALGPPKLPQARFARSHAAPSAAELCCAAL